MAQTLNWVFNLYNNVSGPANQATQSVNRLNGALRQTTVQMNQVNIAFNNFGNQNKLTANRIGLAAGAWSGFFRVLGLGVRRVVEASESFLDFGLKATMFGENTTLAMRAILQSGPAAAAAKAEFQGLTSVTSLGLERITRYGSALMQLGESADSVAVAIKVLGAVQVAKGGGDVGAEAADRVFGLMLQLKTGEIAPNKNQLRRLLADAGTTTEELEKMVVRLSGGRVELAQVQRDLLAGKIPGEALYSPLVAAMQTKIGGATVGATAANAANNSAGGLIQRIKDNLFIDFDFSKLPGFDTLKSVLKNLVTLTEPGGAFQKNMQDFATSFSEFLDPLKGPQGLERMTTFFNNLTTLAQKALPIVSAVAKAIGVIVDYLANTPGPFSNAKTATERFADQVAADKAARGAATGPRIVLPDTYLNGRGSGAGSGTDRPGVVPPIPTSTQLWDSNRGRAGAITLPPITLHIHTSGTSKDEAKQISDAVQDTLPTALQRAFENIATQAGY